MKTKAKKISVVLVIVMLICLLLSFDVVAEPVAKAIKWPVEKLTFVVKNVGIIALGIFLITSGVGAMAVPVVGVGLIVIGLALVSYSAWNFFKKPSPND